MGGMGADAPIHPNFHSKSGDDHPTLFPYQHAIFIGTGLLVGVASLIAPADVPQLGRQLLLPP